MSRQTSEIRLEKAEITPEAALIELSVWTDGEKCHTALVEVVQSRSVKVPHTLAKDPARFWSSAIQVAAEILAAHLRADPTTLPERVRPDALFVEQWAWGHPVSTVQSGGVISVVEAAGD
jgi:ABC-type Fe2+-enterobactin transport system substrate-binding protein